MSECEKINAKVKVQMAARRKEAIVKLVVVLLWVLAALGSFVGLKVIGFISGTFMIILMAITVCVGVFRAGWISRDIKF